MIQVKFNEPDTDAWKAWRTKAENARIKAVQDYEEWALEIESLDGKEEIKAWSKRKPKINEDLYKEMRDLYLKIFHFKCAYCETKLQENQGGDVEHFRPKGRILGANKKPLLIEGKNIPRPGYYWLAYEWTNLMPACSYCNRPSQAIGAPESFGKRDLFPLVDESKRAESPGEEQFEEPLLLNPYDPEDDPSRHLIFEENGIVAPRIDEETGEVSVKGENSIRIFGLHRPILREARCKEFARAWKLKMELMVELMERVYPNKEKRVALKKEVNSIKNGETAYSAIGRTAIREYTKRLHETIND